MGAEALPFPDKEDHVPLLSGSRAGPIVDIGALLDATAVERVVSLVSCGALVSIYRTRDGGALGITVTYDGESEKEYFRLAEELADWLGEVDKAVEGMTKAPSSGKRRVRGA